MVALACEQRAFTNRAVPRRQSKNRTGISRIEGVVSHDAWVGFVCVNCGHVCTLRVGDALLAPEDAFNSAAWQCGACRFVHSSNTNLPQWPNWPPEHRAASSTAAQRFWQGFFRIYTEDKKSYWKQCNTCNRVQPFHAFSRHVGWGPLELQMECRGCKGAINAVLNPRRTKEQLHESALRRRVADLLLKGENERLSFADLFERFEKRCFKTGKPLKIAERDTWQIDHILPSRWLYPLTQENACLLSTDANQNKKAQWPSGFFTPEQLIRLARLTGANLDLLASPVPVVNANIDVDRCVTRFLTVRQKTGLAKRIAELKAMLVEYELVDRLSQKNRRLLGL